MANALQDLPQAAPASLCNPRHVMVAMLYLMYRRLGRAVRPAWSASPQALLILAQALSSPKPRPWSELQHSQCPVAGQTLHLVTAQGLP